MPNQLSIKSTLKNILSDYTVVFGILVLVIVTSFIEPRFLTVANLINIMRQF